jgi:hypothetical protein
MKHQSFGSAELSDARLKEFYYTEIYNKCWTDMSEADIFLFSCYLLLIGTLI